MTNNNVFQLECSLNSISNESHPVRTYRGQINLNDNYLQHEGLNNNQPILAKLESRDGSVLIFKYSQGSGQVEVDTSAKTIRIQDRNLGEFQRLAFVTNESSR